MKLSILLISGLLLIGSGCKKKLPKCDSEKTKDLISEIFSKPNIQAALKKSGEQITGYKEYTEVSFDEDKQKRICTVKVSTNKTTKKMKYQIKWLNKKKGRFEVKVLGESK